MLPKEKDPGRSRFTFLISTDFRLDTDENHDTIEKAFDTYIDEFINKYSYTGERAEQNREEKENSVDERDTDY